MLLYSPHSVLFAVSWKIKAQLEEAIRLADEEDMLEDDPKAQGAEVMASPLHNPFGDGAQRSRSFSTSIEGGKAPMPLYQEDRTERRERLTSRTRSASKSSKDRGSFGGVGFGPGSGSGRISETAGRSSSIAEMFTPAPVTDTEGRIRLNSFTPM